jgi:hypothetical protein
VNPATQKSLAAVLAALLIGGTMGLLGLAGDGERRGLGRPDPDFPTLADDPLPGATGTVAVRRNGAVPCLSVVDVATGEVRDLRCERDLTGSPTWTAEGLVEVHRRSDDEVELLLIDPDDGELRDRRLVGDHRVHDPEQPQRRTASDGRRLVVGSDEDSTWLEVVSADGSTERVLDAPTDAWRGFTSTSWSPADRFALVEGDHAVYLIDPATGEARVLAADAAAAVWRPVDAAW